MQGEEDPASHASLRKRGGWETDEKLVQKPASIVPILGERVRYDYQQVGDIAQTIIEGIGSVGMLDPFLLAAKMLPLGMKNRELTL